MRRSKSVSDHSRFSCDILQLMPGLTFLPEQLHWVQCYLL